MALDTAIGASFGGVRAFAAMKHVGLNVAADALMSQSYIGANGGLVIAVCDDPGIHSSQNEQDTRLFARMALVPVLEPSDQQEALDYTRLAFEVSERFDTPVILRGSTRLSHSRGKIWTGSRSTDEPKPFLERPDKNVMIPAHARARHPVALERERLIGDWLVEAGLTRREDGPDGATDRVGYITAGPAYTYLREILPDAPVLKLGASYPLPTGLIEEFVASYDRVLVVEELEGVIEESVRVRGIAVEGKAYFPRTGELSPEMVRAGLVAAGVLAPPEKTEAPIEFEPLIRPPLLCAGCPHSTCYLALRSANARVMGDIGCYTLAVVEPLSAIDTCVAMGSGIANAAGLAKAGTESKPIVATIGDSTFMHSGITPLIDAVYNNANITVFILDNHITAMTGGQDHPGTGKTLRGKETHKVDYEALVRAIGVTWVQQIDSYDVANVQRVLGDAIDHRGVSVIISDRPCVLDPVRIKGPAMTVVPDDCTACQACMNLGCPAITWSDEWHDGRHRVEIDQTLCIGCSLCAQLCAPGGIIPAADAPVALS